MHSQKTHLILAQGQSRVTGDLLRYLHRIIICGRVVFQHRIVEKIFSLHSQQILSVTGGNMQNQSVDQDLVLQRVDVVVLLNPLHGILYHLLIKSQVPLIHLVHKTVLPESLPVL